MKKVPFLRLLTAVGSALSAVALLDLTGVANVLGPGLSNYLLAAGPIALALKELVVGVGDILDDGKANRSFKLTVACSRRTRRAPAIKRRSLTPCPLGGHRMNWRRILSH